MLLKSIIILPYSDYSTFCKWIKYKWVVPSLDFLSNGYFKKNGKFQRLIGLPGRYRILSLVSDTFYWSGSVLRNIEGWMEMYSEKVKWILEPRSDDRLLMKSWHPIYARLDSTLSAWSQRLQTVACPTFHKCFDRWLFNMNRFKIHPVSSHGEQNV